MRLALGATRADLIGNIFTEGLIIAAGAEFSACLSRLRLRAGSFTFYPQI